MTLGQKIKKLRTDKGLTQKDLADKVFVTFQTVSKWEKDENEPDVLTLRELAKLFGCSMDYLLSEDEEEIKKENKVIEEKAVPPTQVINKTVIIHQKEAHVCRRCGKDIDEKDLAVDHVCDRLAGRGRAATYHDEYYHKECLAKTNAERLERERIAKENAAKRSKKRIFVWSIVGGTVALALTLVVLFVVPQARAAFNPGIIILLGVLVSYLFFSDIYCILSGSYVADVFLGVSGWSIKLPGVIFTWDLDGIAWLIVMKIFLAFLGLFLAACVLALAIAISGILAMLSFPFILISNNHRNYSDAIV